MLLILSIYVIRKTNTQNREIATSRLMLTDTLVSQSLSLSYKVSADSQNKNPLIKERAMSSTRVILLLHYTYL